MTAEEIKEKVAKEKGYKDWETCINDQPNYMVEKLMDIVIEEYAQQKQDKWIRVEDGLPDKGTEIDMYIPSWSSPVAYGEYNGSFNAINSIGTYDDVCYDVKPSHWKYRPTPPIE